MALCHAGSPRRRAPPAAVSISPTADVATSCLAGSMDAPLAPPRPLAGASSGIPQLRSCRTAPTSAKPTASNGPGSTANTSVLTPGGSLFTELRLRRARTVSGNSNASTSSSSSFSSYVPTTRSSASAAAAFSQGDTDDDEADMAAFDMEADDVPDRITGTSTGNSTRPSDEFRGVLQTATAPCLPPPPYPVDPYHFYCRPGMDVAAAAAAIAELLADMDVESRFHPLKTKFRGVKYVHYSHVEFVIRVYSTSISSSSSNSGNNGTSNSSNITSNIGTGNNSNFNINNVSNSVSNDALLVECQRRSGSALLWDGLYHALFQRLRPIIDAAAPPCPQSGAQKKVALTKPPVDAALGVQVWQALADPSGAAPTPSSGVAAIKIMLTSKYTDAQREGCAALAVLTEDAQNVRLVASFQLLEPLVRAAEARDADMARSATGALANMALALQAIESEHKEHAIEQLRRAAGVVLARLERRVHHEWSLYALELLRESARACDAFGQSGVLLPEDVDRARRVLQHYAQHRDRQLSSLCRAALRRLGLEHEDSSMEDPVERA